MALYERIRGRYPEGEKGGLVTVKSASKDGIVVTVEGKTGEFLVEPDQIWADHKGELLAAISDKWEERKAKKMIQLNLASEGGDGNVVLAVDNFEEFDLDDPAAVDHLVETLKLVRAEMLKDTGEPNVR